MADLSPTPTLHIPSMPVPVVFEGGIQYDAMLAQKRYYEKYPNHLAWLRDNYLRDAACEFFGCFMLLLIGAGVDLQVTLSSSTAIAAGQHGSYLSCSLGWAAGAACACWIASASGAHINPAVTLAMAIFRGFSWKKLPIYITAQILGACTGALFCYMNYAAGIAIYDPAKTQQTAALFATYAQDYVPAGICFYNELLGTAVLLFVSLAASDPRNGRVPAGILPVVTFLLLLAEGVALGLQTAYALNPARDLGARLALFIAGYSSQVIWTYRSQYWLWSAIIAPILGASVGTLVYDVFVYNGEDSLLNAPSSAALRSRLTLLETPFATPASEKTLEDLEKGLKVV